MLESVQQFKVGCKRAKRLWEIRKKTHDDFQEALYEKYPADSECRLFAMNFGIE